MKPVFSVLPQIQNLLLGVNSICQTREWGLLMGSHFTVLESEICTLGLGGEGVGERGEKRVSRLARWTGVSSEGTGHMKELWEAP